MSDAWAGTTNGGVRESVSDRRDTRLLDLSICRAVVVSAPGHQRADLYLQELAELVGAVQVVTGWVPGDEVPDGAVALTNYPQSYVREFGLPDDVLNISLKWVNFERLPPPRRRVPVKRMPRKTSRCRSVF